MLLALSGCAETPADLPTNEAPLFCDVEEPREFDVHVWEWRKRHDRRELAKDLKTNETGKRECGWRGPGVAK